MPDEKKLYLVLSRLDHDKRYETGDKVHLTEEEAETLLRASVVQPHETEGAGEPDKPLADMSKDELIAVGKTYDLTFPGNMGKEKMINLIAEERAKEK